MRRSDALAELSRDHHHALVVARELERATAASAAAVAARFVDFLGRHELAHFAVEESVLLPALSATSEGEAFGRRMLADHEQLRAARRVALRRRDTAYLHELGGRLRSHVQLEEREVFPYLERTLDEAGLRALDERLERAVEAARPPRP
jgi:hemerythrin-like domain-containing protein